MIIDTLGDFLHDKKFAETWAKHRGASIRHINGHPVLTFTFVNLPLIMRLHIGSFCDKIAYVEALRDCLSKKIPLLIVRANYNCIRLGNAEVGYTSIIELSKSLQEIYRSFEKDVRNQIRQAKNKGVKVEIASSELEFDLWWKSYIQLTERKRIAREKYDHVFELWRKNFGKLFLAYYRREIIAGIFVLVNDKAALWWLGASDERYNSFRPNHLLQWELIEWLKKEGLSIYDMGGLVKDLDHGPTKFKRGFGGYTSKCYVYNFNLDPILSRVINLLVKVRLNIIKRW